MKDMWKSRSPPTPLDFDAILNGTFQQQSHHGASANNTNDTPKNCNSTGLNSNPTLRDQRTLTLKDSLDLFISRWGHCSAVLCAFVYIPYSTDRLASRLRQGEDTISFDKDDDDTLDFVTASSNLRSYAYGIETKTRWEVKGLILPPIAVSVTDRMACLEMAGNIIPAIATTNAIISGLIVLQALHLLKKSYPKLRNVHLQFKPAVPLSAIRLSAPNLECGICRDTYAILPCDTSRTLLGDVVRGILGDCERAVSVYEDKRVLSDPDWEDNFDRTLESLNVTRGKFLSIVDDDGDWSTISLALSNLP